jgi:serine protease Do
MNKMKRFLFILSVLVLCIGCKRRGGNYNNRVVSQSSTNQRVSSSASDRHRPSTSVATDNTGVSLPSSRNSSKTYTGAEIFARYSSAVFMVYTQAYTHGSQGSAFFISESGIAVSNYHVFESTYQGLEEFHMSDGSVYKLKRVIAKSKENDIFIFQVDGDKSFNYIPLSTHTPRVGERIYTIGSPKGLENTFSSGEISQLRGTDIIQISAPIDHGSSGGVLLNEYGEAIGITTAGLDDSGANLNFAVSIELVKSMLR